MKIEGTIGFEKLKILCIIGTTSNERVVPQEIYVDLKLKTDLLSAAFSDDLQQTIDYTEVAQLCHKVAQNSYFLLEAYALNLLNQLFAQFKIEWASVTVRKPSAIPNSTAAFVELSASLPKNLFNIYDQDALMSKIPPGMP